MPTSAAQLMVNVGANVSPATGQLGGLIGMLGGPLNVAALGAAAAVVGVGVASVKMAGDFQSGITSLVTGAGEAQGNIGLVSKGILGLATDTGTSTQQLISGMYMIESAGYHGKAGLDVLKAAAEGAKVGQADLGTVADATTTIMKDYPNVLNGASGAVNLLIGTVASGKTHMQDLAGAMAQILPTASAAGIGLNDVMGAMATMTGEGVPAANAATYLRQTILALEAPSAGTTKALKAVGLSTTAVANEMHKSLPGAIAMITEAVGKKFPKGSAGYIAALKNIAGGSKQMQGVLDLSGKHMADFTANAKGIGEQAKKGGQSIVGWSLVQGDFNQKLSVAKEHAEAFMITLGTALLPILSRLLDVMNNSGTTIANLIHWFQQGSPAAQGVEAVIVLLTGALGGFAAYMIATAIPAIIASVTAFGAQAVAAGAAAIATLAAAAPFILIGIAIAAVAIGIYELITHWKQVSAFLEGVWKAVVAGVIAGFTWIGNEAHALWSNIVGAFNSGVNAVKGFFAGLGAWITGEAGLLWKRVQAVFWAGVAFIQAIIRGGFELVKTIIFAQINAIVGIFSWLYNHNYYFKNLVDGIVREFNFLKNVITIIWNDITGWIVGTWTKLVGFAKLYYAAIIAEIDARFNQAKSIVTNVWNTIVGWVTGMWTKLVGEARLRFMAIYVEIEARINQVKARIEAVWTTIYTNIVAVGTRIYVAVSGAWNRVTSFIGGLASTVGGKVKSGVIDPITGAITGLVSTAESWGANLLKMFISGITGQIGNLKNTVSNVMSNVASFLGFHSPAKEGPGATADTWAPNLMAMYADGLRAARPRLALAAAHALGGVSDALGGGSGFGHLHLGNVSHGGSPAISQLALSPAAQVTQALAASGGGSGGGGASGTPIILQIDGHTFARLIAPYQVATIRNAVGIRTS